MASVQCSKCKQGIHYHSEPNGIEYRYISLNDWSKICASKFDKTNIEMDMIEAYPKLFRSDTIEEDFPDCIIKFWVCPHCGNIILFDKEGNVSDTFAICEEIPEINKYTEGIVFDDYSWDELTEECLPDIKLKDITPTAFVKIGDTYIISSKNDIESVYKKSE